MDEDISDEEIGPSALRMAAMPEPEVNEHVRVTTLDEREVAVDDVKERVAPEEERVPSPLERRVPSHHFENLGPSASEQHVSPPLVQPPHSPLKEQVSQPLELPPHSPLKEQPPHSPLKEKPPHSPFKVQVSPPLEEQITLAPAEQYQDDARNVWGGMVVEEPESSLKAGEEAAQSEELKIPGSFDMEAEPPHEQQHSWIDMLRHLHLKQ